MPTYEYSCEKCGQNFDAFQSMRDEPFRECPKELCRLPEWGHGKVKRLLGYRRRFDLQRIGILYHRLPKRFLQRGSQKGISCYLKLVERNPPSRRNLRKASVACSDQGAREEEAVQRIRLMML